MSGESNPKDVGAGDAAANRRKLVSQYVDAFRKVEAAGPEGPAKAGRYEPASSALKDLSASISSAVVTDKQPALNRLIDAQRAKLS